MNRLLLLVLIFLFTIVGCGGGGSSSTSSSSTSSLTAASDIILGWTSPHTNADTNTLTDLRGYKIYFGQVAGTYNDTDSPQDIVCVSDTNLDCGCTIDAACTYTVAQALLGAGKWCFVITAYDNNLNESVYSEQVCRP